MKTAVILSPKNAAAIAKYSKSVGWTETELANHLLNETLSDGRFDLNVTKAFPAVDIPIRFCARKSLLVASD